MTPELADPCPVVHSPAGAIRPTHRMRATVTAGAKTWTCRACGTTEPRGQQ